MRVRRFRHRHLLQAATHLVSEQETAQSPPLVLALGNFDGVHKGHQVLLNEVLRLAKQHNYIPAVMSFDPHPREFFAAHFATQAPSSQPLLRLFTLGQNIRILAQYGVEQVLLMHFDKDFSQLSAEDFVHALNTPPICAQYVVIGEDFRFGANRKGNAALLQTLMPQRVSVISTVGHNTSVISSSNVRKTITQKDFAQVKELLGRPYALAGRVVHGQKLGRTLGFPTLNLSLGKIKPAVQGIYVVRVFGLFPDKTKAAYGVANVGTRPAVDTQNTRYWLEAFIFDYNSNAYGYRVDIEFLHHLHEEIAYGGLDALKAGIAADVAQARAYLQHIYKIG